MCMRLGPLPGYSLLEGLALLQGAVGMEQFNVSYQYW